MRTTTRMMSLIAALALACTLVGCKRLKPIRTEKAGGATDPATATATAKADPDTKKVEPPQPPPKPGTPPPMRSGAHILIAYKGAMRAMPNVTRTKDEASKLAKVVLAQTKKDPSKFAELAKKNSNGPSAAKGGSLGAWRKGQMVPAFDNAIDKLKIDEIAAEPVVTPFGYHIIIRTKLPPMFAGAHILIAYKGAMRAMPNVTRTKEVALKLAKELTAKAKKAPDTFTELAKKNSNGPSGPRGGILGKWPKGRMVPAFDEAIGKLKIDEISVEPVETPFGYHIMKRLDPDKLPQP
jgi:hypothetical protein